MTNNMVQNANGGFIASQQVLFDYKTKITLQPGRIITLKLEKPKAKMSTSTDFGLGGYMDPDTHEWMGFPKRVLPDGTYEFRKLRFRGVKSFDLGILDQHYEYLCWKNSAFFKGSKNQVLTGNFRGLLVEYDKEAEATKTVNDRSIAHDMEAIIFDWDDQKVKDFGVIYKINPKTNSPTMIKAALFNKLNNNPSELKAHYDEFDKKTQYLIEFRKATYANLITVDAKKGIMYRDIFIGMDEHSAVEKFRKDPQLYLMLKNDVEQQLPGGETRTVTKNSLVKQEQERQSMVIDPNHVAAEVKKQVADFLKDYDLVPKTVAPPVAEIKKDDKKGKTKVAEAAGFEA